MLVWEVFQEADVKVELKKKNRGNTVREKWESAVGVQCKSKPE